MSSGRIATDSIAVAEGRKIHTTAAIAASMRMLPIHNRWPAKLLLVEAVTAGGPADAGESPFGLAATASGGASASTAIKNRYPRRGNVSTNRGVSALSFSASRSRRMAAFNPWSKSTKVSSGHSLARISSRVTSSPERSSSMARIWKGCSCSRSRMPCLRSSRVCRSASKGPNLTRRELGATSAMVAGVYTPCAESQRPATLMVSAGWPVSFVSDMRAAQGIEAKQGIGEAGPAC